MNAYSKHFKYKSLVNSVLFTYIFAYRCRYNFQQAKFSCVTEYSIWDASDSFCKVAGYKEINITVSEIFI